MTRLAVVLALTACAPAPAAREPVATSPTPHCFRLVFRFDGRDQAGMACGETLALCRNAQARAVRFGGMAGIREAGTCRREVE